MRKRSFIHSDQDVKGTLKKLQAQFKDYQLALYLYAHSTFLEVMLLGNYSAGYLTSMEDWISHYALQNSQLDESLIEAGTNAGHATGFSEENKIAEKDPRVGWPRKRPPAGGCEECNDEESQPFQKGGHP